jgi:hypothetical protein
MPTFPDLIAKILNETLACQDLTSPEAKGRVNGRYAPFGPHIPGESGGYPTTDAAMEALADLADRFRANDASLSHAVSRDALQIMASRVMGELLPKLTCEPNSNEHWPMVRDRLRVVLQDVGQDLVQYVPVWLFRGQESAPFSIGPVRFIKRKDWIEAVAARRGRESSWMPAARTIWSGGRLSSGSLWAGLKAGVCAAVRSPSTPSAWARAFRGARLSSQPREEVNARTVARTVHPDQWIACAQVTGFEREESHRRGVLAARVALDTIRLVLPGSKRHLLSTAADSVVPLSVDRLSQAKGEDLAHGWRFNRPGLSGAPGMARAIVAQSAPLFEAGGACMAAAVTSANTVHGCPKLADRWCNAVHWFGRACLSDGDFVAVVMLVIALDVLCGGKEAQGITELTARLTNAGISAPVLPDGTTLKQLIYQTYKLRSEVAHGSVLAVHATLDVERAQLEGLTAVAIEAYAVQLHGYAQNGGVDDRDAFLKSLPPAKP